MQDAPWPEAVERLLLHKAWPTNVADSSYAVAIGIDDAAHPQFSRQWLEGRDAPFVLAPGDMLPIQDMQLPGLDHYSSHPYRLGTNPTELPHIRQVPATPIQMEIDPTFGDIVDGLLAGDEIRVAAVLPNVDGGELTAGGFPITPRDAERQTTLLTRAVERAVEEGCQVIVLPEIALPMGALSDLSAAIAEAQAPLVLYAGSSHVELKGERANLAPVLFGGIREPAWTHRKLTRFEAADGAESEEIELPNPPTITIATGAHVRIAAMICKDILSHGHAGLLGDLGVHLVGVPAMSAKMDEFGGPAIEVMRRSQGVVVVANNPQRWNEQDVTHGLLSRPVGQFSERVVVTGPAVAPGLAIGTLQSGWRPFIAVNVADV